MILGYKRRAVHFQGGIEVARFAELRFGHMPAGRRLEDLEIIKSGMCPADATQSCRNCACLCAPISLCLHGFFFIEGKHI